MCFWKETLEEARVDFDSQRPPGPARREGGESRTYGGRSQTFVPERRREKGMARTKLPIESTSLGRGGDPGMDASAWGLLNFSLKDFGAVKRGG